MDLLKSAKQTKSKFPWQTEENQINNEMFNMIRNQDLLKVRKEETIAKQHRKHEKPPKRVTWSKNLFEVHTITYGEYQETRLPHAIWPGENCLTICDRQTEQQTWSGKLITARILEQSCKFS
jgi:hypothetical protein